MATTPNYGWVMPDPTDFVTNLPADFEVFGDAVDDTVKDLNPGTTAGDLDYYTSSTAKARLGIGTAGQVLRVNSGATAPEWVTPSAGAMILISETVASGLSSLSLTSIPQTYTQLMLVWSGIYHSNNSTIFNLRFNNDSGASAYSRNIFFADNNFLGNESSADNTADSTTAAVFGRNMSTSSTNKVLAAKGSLFIDNYTSTTKNKYYNIENGFQDNTSRLLMAQVNGVYNSNTAITSIDIVRAGAGTFSNVTDTSIRLYGIV